MNFVKIMNKSFLTFLLLLMAMACGKKHDVSPASLFKSYDRQGMLQNIGNTIVLPAYQKFSNRTDSLGAACTLFTAEPTEATLIKTQDQWKATSSCWKYCELFNLGPEAQLLLKDVIESWPISPSGIETAINTSSSIDPSYINTRNTNVQGLKALEYLLFDPLNGNAAIVDKFKTDTNRRNYLNALCKYLHGKADVLYNAWKPAGGNYIQTFIAADGNDVSSSIGKLVNLMSLQLEEIKNMKMDSSASQSSESPYSRTSLENISDNLIAMENTFLGRSSSGGEQRGLDDLLDHLDAKYNNGKLSDEIKSRFDQAISKVAVIHPPLEVALSNDPGQIKDANVALKALLVIVRVDMVNSLGVLLTFSDLDGD